MTQLKYLDGFDKMTSSSEQFNIVKGALNKLRLRPQIQNEYSESSREALGTVDTNTAVGQFFKTSKENINGISLTVQSAATFASMDAITSGAGENKAGTMEYSSSVALQAEYIKSGADEAVRTTFTDLASVTQDGSYCIGMDLSGVVDDEWRVTLTSTDLTGVTFSLKYAQNISQVQAKLFFFISDGTNGKSFLLTTSTTNVWQTFTFAETSMSIDTADDGGAEVDMSAITKMGFRIDVRQAGATLGYADSITYQAEGGSFDIELWKFPSLPVGDGTEDYTAVGTQYTEIGDRGVGGFVQSSLNVPLFGGKHKYHIDGFIAGTALEIPTNTLLEENAYYALVLKYVDTDVTVFGANTLYEIEYYTEGYAWKTEVADGFVDRIAGAESSGLYSDLMFQIFSAESVYIMSANVLADSAPNGDAQASIFVEDKNMGITGIVSTVQRGGMGRTSIPFDLSTHPMMLGEGGKFEVYYDDDPTDDVSKILFGFTYLYRLSRANGSIS